MSSRPFVNDIFGRPTGINGEGGQGEYINVYTGQEKILDKYEQNVTIEYNNPLPIIAIVTDLVADSIQWKMPGIVTNGAKELFIYKKYRSLLEQSQKIEIKGEFYEGYRLEGKMQIRELAGNVIRVYVYKKLV
jgi:hypothetical protein